jgi:hypothetical protein
MANNEAATAAGSQPAASRDRASYRIVCLALLLALGALACRIASIW